MNFLISLLRKFSFCFHMPGDVFVFSVVSSDDLLSGRECGCASLCPFSSSSSFSFSPSFDTSRKYFSKFVYQKTSNRSGFSRGVEENRGGGGTIPRYEKVNLEDDEDDRDESRCLLVDEKISSLPQTSTISTPTSSNAISLKDRIAHNFLIRLRTLSHPWILQYQAHEETDQQISIWTEHVVPLREIIHTLHPMHLHWFVYQIASVMAYLHNSLHISHSRLTPTSIFVTTDGPVEVRVGGWEYCGFTSNQLSEVASVLQNPLSALPQLPVPLPAHFPSYTISSSLSPPISAYDALSFSLLLETLLPFLGDCEKVDLTKIFGEERTEKKKRHTYMDRGRQPNARGDHRKYDATNETLTWQKLIRNFGRKNNNLRWTFLNLLSSSEFLIHPLVSVAAPLHSLSLLPSTSTTFFPTSESKEVFFRSLASRLRLLPSEIVLDCVLQYVLCPAVFKEPAVHHFFPSLFQPYYAEIDETVSHIVITNVVESNQLNPIVNGSEHDKETEVDKENENEIKNTIGNEDDREDKHEGDHEDEDEKEKQKEKEKEKTIEKEYNSENEHFNLTEKEKLIKELPNYINLFENSSKQQSQLNSYETILTVPNDPTKIPTVPNDPTKTPTVPNDPTKTPTVPNDPTKTPTIPNDPTKTPTVRNDPTKSNHISQSNHSNHTSTHLNDTHNDNGVLPYGKYQAYIIPFILSNYITTDRLTRLALLYHIPVYILFLDLPLLSSLVFPQLLFGLCDINRPIVEASVCAIDTVLSFFLSLSHDGNDVVEMCHCAMDHLASLALYDSDPYMRRYTLQYLAYALTSPLRPILPHALISTTLIAALGDPNPSVCFSALIAISEAKHIIPSDVCALGVVPAISSLFLAPNARVRHRAHLTMYVVLKEFLQKDKKITNENQKGMKMKKTNTGRMQSVGMEESGDIEDACPCGFFSWVYSLISTPSPTNHPSFPIRYSLPASAPKPQPSRAPTNLPASFLRLSIQFPSQVRPRHSVFHGHLDGNVTFNHNHYLLRRSWIRDPAQKRKILNSSASSNSVTDVLHLPPPLPKPQHEKQSLNTDVINSFSQQTQEELQTPKVKRERKRSERTPRVEKVKFDWDGDDNEWMTQESESSNRKEWGDWDYLSDFSESEDEENEGGEEKDNRHLEVNGKSDGNSISSSTFFGLMDHEDSMSGETSEVLKPLPISNIATPKMQPLKRSRLTSNSNLAWSENDEEVGDEGEMMGDGWGEGDWGDLSDD
jgi:hypothetical protein